MVSLSLLISQAWHCSCKSTKLHFRWLLESIKFLLQFTNFMGFPLCQILVESLYKFLLIDLRVEMHFSHQITAIANKNEQVRVARSHHVHLSYRCTCLLIVCSTGLDIASCHQSYYMFLDYFSYLVFYSKHPLATHKLLPFGLV